MEPMTTLPFTGREVARAVPIVLPALFGLVTLLLDLFLPKGKSKGPLAITAAAGAVVTAIVTLVVWRGEAELVQVAGTLTLSSFTAALSLSILLATAVISFAGMHHAEGEPGVATQSHGEFYALMLFATSGMLGLVAANDLVTLFVALETLSIAVYAMTGMDRRRSRSAEGAMKYFVLGAFSSGFLLYGMSLLYGATGTMRLSDMAVLALDARHANLAATGGMLVLVGLLFKVGAVPFHSWTPDAYEGAPAAVTGFMSVGVKVAAFGAALRVVTTLGDAGALAGGAWALWLVAALTVIVGNAGALTQRNPRRLLAYSAIAHSGYVLVGVLAVARAFDPDHPLAGPTMLDVAKDATSGVIFYLLSYAVANLAAFAVLCHLERKGEEVDDIADLAGLAKVQPGAALAMTLAMISLAGVPATAGFLGKFWVFRAGIAAGDLGLVILALATSALSLYYYLQVVVVMYMREPGEAIAQGEPGATRSLVDEPRRWGSRLAYAAAAVLIVVLGVYPGQRLLALVVEGAEALL